MDQGEYQSDEGQDQDADQSSEMYKVVVDGQEHQVPLDELISGYQRQADYTQKTQSLADEKKRYESMVEEKATELYLKALQESEQGQTQYSGNEQAGGDEISRLRQELESLKTHSADKEADEELNKIMSGLREKYPDMDEEKVLIRFNNEAQEHDDPGAVFDRLARESHESYGTMRQSIIEDYIKQKQVNPFSSGETGGSTTPAVRSDKPVSSFEEARERAEQRLRGLGG